MAKSELEFSNDVERTKEMYYTRKFESIEKDLDQMYNDQDQKIKADEKLNSIKKKLKQLKGLVSQYEKQQSMEKPPSFSDQQWISGAHEPKKISEDWKNLQIEKYILASPMMSNLQLSYDLLDIQLRLCLLCFAVFPEKVIIKKRPLIYWWKAQGFISKSDKKSAEEVGEKIFRELIDKGMIQPWFKNDKMPIVDSCTVRPWIRRMLINQATLAGFFDFDEMGKLTCSSIKSRCLCFPMDDKWPSSSDSILKRELTTMFNVNESYLSFEEDFLSKFEKLKILQLGRWQSSLYHHIEVGNNKFLNGLQVQKHLKYLSLRGISRITALPSSIIECRNLEILDLKGCHTLESLPPDFGSLRKLTHLDFSECYLLESMPNNLHKLTLLQVLKGFDVEKYPSSLKAFDQLQKLRKLSLILQTRQAQEPFDDLNWFFSLKNLCILTLTWRMGLPKNVEQSTDRSFPSQGLQENLEKLDLRCFPFKRRPNWLAPNIFKKLKRLYIRGGGLEELILNDTERYLTVEILRLKHLKNLKLEPSEVKKHFPTLTHSEMIALGQNAANGR